MNIGIIGAGHVGSALAHVFSALGHRVRIANSRSPDTLSEPALENGTTAVWAADAVSSAELLVIAIPEKGISALPSDIFRQAATDLVIIDTGNYYPKRDGAIHEIDDGLPESAWVSKCINRPVIKVFNNVDPKLLLISGKAKGEEQRIALPIAGDDAKAKALVMQLVDDIGFDPIDGGPLAESWRQQPGTPTYGTNLDGDGVRRGLAEASMERRGEWVSEQ